MCEAAFAWRGEQRSLGLELALRTRASARAVSFDDVVFLAEALATVLGGPRFAPSGAWPGRDPSFAIQTLGLRAIAEGPSPELFVQATGLAGQLKHLNPTTRLELLSIEEGLIATGA